MRARDVFNKEEYEYVKSFVDMFNGEVVYIEHKGDVIYENAKRRSIRKND